MSVNVYLNNPNLRAANVPYPYTEAEIKEFKKCKNDPIYFIEKYIKIVHPDKGLILLKLFDYQKEMIISYWKNRKTISNTSRQLGKTTVAAAFFCWYTIFNSNKTCAILANKALLAREILSRYQLAYENLPKFLQQGVITWNKGSCELENGSRVIASATSSSAIRGYSVSLLYLDEFAHVQQNIAEEFFTSVYPTLSAGKETKLIITSTPNGYNLFYKLFTEAMQKVNDFNPIQVAWDRHPDRDEKWKIDQLAILGEDKFAQEHETEFLGSTNTLIPKKYIKMMVEQKPIQKTGPITIYQEPIKKDPDIEGSTDHNYLIVCDPAEGVGGDDTAFVVFDITDFPIKIVAKYIDNNISPLLLPTILETVAKKYNEAHVLIEINNQGQQVANILWRDNEYMNCVMFGFHGNENGIRTTKLTKRLGCTLFKNMIENQKLIINDLDCKAQISTFIRRKTGYAAEDGHKDDLVMCLVLFAWFASTEEYKNITNMSLRKALQEQRMQFIQEEILSFFIDDGVIGLEVEDEMVSEGWFPV